MKGILLLTILTTQSSYLREIETPLEGASDIPDTVQWWIAPESSWRIRTYAMDHDIHTYEMPGARSNFTQTARQNTEKHYADIIGSQYELSFGDCTNVDEVKHIFSRAGIAPRLEVAAGRFAFWKPDDARYFTQSTPKD